MLFVLYDLNSLKRLTLIHSTLTHKSRILGNWTTQFALHSLHSQLVRTTISIAFIAHHFIALYLNLNMISKGVVLFFFCGEQPVLSVESSLINYQVMSQYNSKSVSLTNHFFPVTKGGSGLISQDP